MPPQGGTHGCDALHLRCGNCGFPKLGILFWGPYAKDCNILGSIFGSPSSGKLPDCMGNQRILRVAGLKASNYKPAACMVTSIQKSSRPHQ